MQNQSCDCVLLHLREFRNLANSFLSTIWFLWYSRLAYSSPYFNKISIRLMQKLNVQDMYKSEGPQARRTILLNCQLPCMASLRVLFDLSWCRADYVQLNERLLMHLGLDSFFLAQHLFLGCLNYVYWESDLWVDSSLRLTGWISHPCQPSHLVMIIDERDDSLLSFSNLIASPGSQ